MTGLIGASKDKFRFDTIAVRGNYDEGASLAAQGAIGEPLYFGPAQHFGSAEAMRACLAGEAKGWVYGRLGNPTVEALEGTLALLETYGSAVDAEAAVTASGMFAIFAATNPFLAAGNDRGVVLNIVASAGCYGGTHMLFQQRYEADRGIQIRWVAPTAPAEEWEKNIDPGTRFIFVETPSNPGLCLIDILALAEVSERYGVPLIVDSTVATPALQRPLTQGADIVVHSASKTMSASGLSIAGALIARKSLRSKNGPAQLRDNFARYAKNTIIREIGGILSPFNALMTLADLRFLRSNVDRFSTSAAKIARFLQDHPAVDEVRYPGLPTHESYKLACRDLRLVDACERDSNATNRFGSLLSFRPRGGPEAAFKTLDNLKLFWRANDLGRVKSTATIPAIATHGQLDEEARKKSSISGDLIRLSIGQEDPSDLINDLAAALEGNMR